MLALYINLDVFGQNDLKYASYNIVFNSLIGGFGSAIHHKHNESFFYAFVQGSYKGAIGGSLNYSALKIISSNKMSCVWPAKLINSLGTSITINAIDNLKILSSYQIDIYCFNIRFAKNIKCKFDPLTFGYATYLSFNKSMSFDFNSTLLTGSVIFMQKEKAYDGLAFGLLGRCFGNTAYYQKTNEILSNVYMKDNKVNCDKYIQDISHRILTHEIIHTFQYERYSILNDFAIDKIYKSNYLYLNFNFGFLYLINGNAYENEANHFSN